MQNNEVALELPDGLTARPLDMPDANAVFEVAARQEQQDLGKVEIEAADIISDWQRPSFDIPGSTLGVFDGDLLVAYAEVSRSGRGDAAVDPAYRRRGLGTSLATWMQARTNELGGKEIGAPVPVGSPGDRLLEKLGYRVRWTSWVLSLPEGRQIQARELPADYAIRTAEPGDHPAVWQVVEDAFLEWSDRDRQSYDDYLASTLLRPGFESWNQRVATDAAGEIVGCAQVIMTGDPATEAYVDRVAVRRDQRRRGLAQALLVDAFEQGREHGASRSALSTDSRTGALDLYLKVGMEIGDVWVNRGIAV